MLAYIASPYTTGNGYTQKVNHAVLLEYMAALYKTHPKITQLSPIAMNHTLAQVHSIAKDSSFWMPHCTTFLKHCEMLIICDMEGWDESHGVQLEIEYFRDISLKNTGNVFLVDDQGELRRYA